MGQVIGNGYNLKNFSQNETSRNQIRAALKITENEFTIGMVGRYDPQKDHENLINALGVIKERGHQFKILLVGRNLDKENKEILSAISKNNLSGNTILLGPRNDIPAIMNGLDLHVLSSSFGEAFPNVIAEAMACGTPCVTTNLGDAAIIVGETGWVVPPQDSQKLAHAIMDAIEENKLKHNSWLKRKDACRNQIAKNFSIETMISSYNNAWNKQ